MPQVTNEMLAEQTRGQTVPSRFLQTVQARPDAVALRAKDGDGWRESTFAEYAEDACRVAAGLQELGVGRGDRVVLMMRNRPEFFVADMAALLVGATPISIYNSSAPEQVQYLAGHCDAKVAILEDVGYLERFLKVRSELPALEHVVLMEDPDGVAPEDVRAWDPMLALDPVDIEAASKIVQPSDLATVIYTSGTTGPPKGVMLDHANICWTAESLRLTLAHVAAEGRRLVSYLPMAHIAERMTSYYQQAMFGYEVTSCPEARDVASYLPQVRPEIFFAVPRIWEKVYAGIQAVVAADPAAEGGVRARVGDGRRQRAGPGPRIARTRPGDLGHHRRRAPPGRDPRVLPRARRAAGRDLRHVGVVGADDVRRRRRARRDGGPRDPGLRGEVGRRRRGDLPGRQRVPRLSRTTPPRRPRRSTPTAGSTPVTSASSTTTAT